MSFFKRIKSSVFDPDFYSKVKHQSLGSAFKYFFLFILLLTTINTVILAYDLGVRAPQEIKNFINRSIASFPADLEVKLRDGQVSTNTQEPYFLPMPKSENEAYSGTNNLLVIDTKTPFSATQFEEYKTVFWLTHDSLFYQNRGYDNRSIALKDVGDMTINKAFSEGLIRKIDPWLNLIGPGLIFLTFVGMFLGFTFNLIYMLLLAGLIFFLSIIFKWGLNYSASYKTAIYASTTAFILDFILFNTGVYTGFFGFPFLFTLVALCSATVNLQNFEEKS